MILFSLTKLHPIKEAELQYKQHLILDQFYAGFMHT